MWPILWRVDACARVSVTVIGFLVGIFLLSFAIIGSFVLMFAPVAWKPGKSILSTFIAGGIFPALVALGFFLPAWCAVRVGAASAIFGHIGWRVPVYAAVAGWSVLLFWLCATY